MSFGDFIAFFIVGSFVLFHFVFVLQIRENQLFKLNEAKKSLYVTAAKGGSLIFLISAILCLLISLPKTDFVHESGTRCQHVPCLTCLSSREVESFSQIQF